MSYQIRLITAFLLFFFMLIARRSFGGEAAGPIDRTFGTHFAFVKVEPGKFLMGSPSDEAGRYKNEELHPVKITKPFEIGETEVTQGLWKKVMGKLPKRVLKLDDNLPVTYVSWNDVQKFLTRLGRMRHDGYEYRLPTEAEWEYAARGGHKANFREHLQPFPFGQSTEAMDQYAWTWNNAKLGAQPVRQLKPNQLGLYDIVGNVWEWTEDTYTKDATQIGVSPRYGHPVSLTKGKGTPIRRVLRGGCWTRNAQVMRSAFRGRLPASADYGNLGVRIVRTQKTGN